jgi:hypothetical protein
LLYYPQSQGSVERGNADIKDMLIIWMRENNSTSWKVGFGFAYFQDVQLDPLP